MAALFGKQFLFRCSTRSFSTATKKLIVCTQPVLPTGLDMIRQAGHEVQIIDPVPKLKEDDYIEAVRPAHGVISMLADPLNQRVISSLPNLQIIAQYAVGLDNVDLDAAKQAGIPVCHTPGCLTDATADQAFALLLAAARNVIGGDRYVRAGKLSRFETTMMLGPGLRNRVLGIIGMGRIGQAMAERAKGFGLRVLYHNRNQLPPEIERRFEAEYVSKEDLLKNSDFVSLHCPLNSSSKHVISKKELQVMKKTAILVNTARGPVVHEQDLADALQNDEIGAAGIDVYEKEPQVNPLLMTLDNVVLAPHLGSATEEARSRMSEMCGEAIVGFFAGADPIPNRAT